MRSIVFRYGDISTFADALSETRGSLSLPEGEAIVDGEWVLAIFEIGSRRRATAAAARGVSAAGDPHLEFERRDWDRLQAFVAARSEHMRSARPAANPSRAKVPAPNTPNIPPALGSTGPMSPPPMSVAPISVGPISVGPISVAPMSEGPLSEMPPSQPIESSRVPLGARVLVVDDQGGSREDVRSMLAEIGLFVEVVASADEATERMREVAFDAVVLDLQAKGDDPLDFVRNLRRDPLRAPLPVLFLSDQTSSRDVVEAFACGADDFLSKPFRAPELGARIFGLLRRARLTRTTFQGGRS